MNPQQFEKLFLIKKTQIELTYDRGFDIGDDEKFLTWSSLDFMVFIRRHGFRREILTNNYKPLDKNDNRRFLAYYGSKIKTQVSVDVVNDFVKVATEGNITDAILILDGPMSNKGLDIIKDITNVNWQDDRHGRNTDQDITNINLQIFQDDELTYNPTKHVKVSRHILLSKEEAIIKMRQMKTDISRLPTMSVDCPISKYYGWKIGDLIKIERNDSSLNILTPKSLNYRIILGIDINQ
jgi:DNA-directed RNA polymerase subunit H (RpoH/RPB5)